MWNSSLLISYNFEKKKILSERTDTSGEAHDEDNTAHDDDGQWDVKEDIDHTANIDQGIIVFLEKRPGSQGNQKTANNLEKNSQQNQLQNYTKTKDNTQMMKLKKNSEYLIHGEMKVNFSS